MKILENEIGFCKDCLFFEKESPSMPCYNRAKTMILAETSSPAVICTNWIKKNENIRE